MDAFKKNPNKFCEDNQHLISIYSPNWQYTNQPSQNDKSVASIQLSDKIQKLKSHFFASLIACEGNSASLVTLLLISIKHWCGNHSHCPHNSQCHSDNYTPSKIVLTHPVAIITLHYVWTTSKPSTNMSQEELTYYVDNLPTSICESFHSFLLRWAPKHRHWSKTCFLRIMFAELHWNENKDRTKKILDKKCERSKGKRARGRGRFMWLEKETFVWFTDILHYIK